MDIAELKRTGPAGVTKRHPWELARARVILFLLKREKKIYSRITDIGSGDAFVTEQLVKHSLAHAYTATDTAYTDEMISRVRSAGNLQDVSFFKTTDNIPRQDKSDGTLLLDVLEHCRDDSAVLADAMTLSDGNGLSIVLITVPAFGSLFSEHDRLLGHYRRYSRTQLTKLCRSKGLEIQKSGYFFFSLLLPRIIRVLIEKWINRKPKKTIDNWPGGILLTKIISGILWTDFRVCYALSRVGIHLPGLSCYCLCKHVPS